jgi:hypothetical protein
MIAVIVAAAIVAVIIIDRHDKDSYIPEPMQSSVEVIQLTPPAEIVNQIKDIPPFDHLSDRYFCNIPEQPKPTQKVETLETLETFDTYEGNVKHIKDEYTATANDRMANLGINRQGVNITRQISGSMNKIKSIRPYLDKELQDEEKKDWWHVYDI